MRLFLILVSVVAVLALSACDAGGSDAPAPARTAAVSISLETKPNPPAVGVVELRFTAKDAQGQPITGGNFDVIADHTDMGGMTMHGLASDQGNGVYSTLINFAMSGNWLLTVQIRKDGLDDKQDIPIQIP